jgi:hypothetical protein
MECGLDKHVCDSAAIDSIGHTLLRKGTLAKIGAEGLAAEESVGAVAVRHCIRADRAEFGMRIGAFRPT